MANLVITETHPVQYHAPVYRALAQLMGEGLVALYGSDFSVAGYRDKEFGASFAWDQDLLSGVESRFVATNAKGGPGSYEDVTGEGLSQALANLNPAALMAVGYAHPFDRSAIDWAVSHKKPLFFRGETSDKAKQRSLLRRWVRDLVLRCLYKRCAALLYVGQNSRAHYERLGVPASKLFFSPYCVDAATFETSADDRARLRQATRQRFGIPQDALVILYSGKLSERKGVDLLADAVRMLPPPVRDRTHLLLVGDGAMRESLEKQCAQAPTVAATFAGFQNQSALSSFSHAADLFTLPSRTMETWGLVVNEALMHGLPCVVSDSVGSQPDLVIPGKTGAVCQSGDASSLATALQEAIKLTSDSGLADRCRAQVAPYSVQAAAAGIRDAWQSVCGTVH